MGDTFFFDFASGASKAYVPYPVYAFEEGMRKCLESGIISPGTTFLDLGAGKGRIVIEAARHGFCAYGIEYHQEHVSDAESKIAEAHRSAAVRNGTICRMVQGSYYLPEYIALRTSGKATALEYEDVFVFEDIGKDQPRQQIFPKKTRHRVFYPVASEHDPFVRLGISFDLVSVFFSYAWGIELPSQLEMFSRYGAQDALFLNETDAEPEKYEELLEALGLRVEKLDVGVDRRESRGIHHTAGLMVYRKN